MTNKSVKRLAFAAALLLGLVLLGSAGYFVLGAGRWSFSECVYMTVITLSTVGFGELSHMGRGPWRAHAHHHAHRQRRRHARVRPG